jgi:hypothetical protein
MSLAMAFGGLWRKVQIIDVAPESIVKGERVRGAEAPPRDIVLVILRITPSQMRHLPEGKYAPGDMQIYGLPDAGLSQGQIVVHQGERFRIEEIVDRSFEGRYVKALAKKERS